MRRSFQLLSAVLPTLALLSACGDPLRVRATEPVLTTTLQLYPLSVSPPTFPGAINTPFALPTSVTASGNFDVAFDLDSEGRVVLMTPRAVITPATGVHRVGFLHAGTSFESVTSVPAGEFTYDSLLTVTPGEVIVVEAHRGRIGDICSFTLSPNIYSKLSVTAVDPETNAISVEFTVDPNCGFRSFEEGIPSG